MKGKGRKMLADQTDGPGRATPPAASCRLCSENTAATAAAALWLLLLLCRAHSEREGERQRGGVRVRERDGQPVHAGGTQSITSGEPVKKKKLLLVYRTH